MLSYMANPSGPALAALDEAGLLHSQEYKTTPGKLKGGTTSLFDQESGAMLSPDAFIARIVSALAAVDKSEAEKRQDIGKMFGSTFIEFFMGGGDLTDKQRESVVRKGQTPTNLGVWNEYGLLQNQEYTAGKRTLTGGVSSMYDEEGAMRPLNEFFGELEAATAEMSQAGRLQFFSQTMGTDAARAGAAGAQMGSEGFMTLQGEMLEISVEQLAEIKRANAAAQWDMLIGKIETVASELGKPLAVYIQDTLEIANEIVDFALQDPEAQRDALRLQQQERQTNAYTFDPDSDADPLTWGAAIRNEIERGFAEIAMVEATKDPEERKALSRQIYEERQDRGVEVSKTRKFEEAQRVYFEAIRGGQSLQDIQEQMNEQYGGGFTVPTDTQVEAGALQRVVAFLDKSRHGGFLGIGGEDLFSEGESQSLGAQIAAGFRAAMVDFRIALQPLPGGRGTPEVSPLPGGRNTPAITPAAQGYDNDSTRNRTQRGETSSAGTYDDYGSGYGGLFRGE